MAHVCHSTTGNGAAKETVQYPAFKVHQPSDSLHGELCVHVSSRGRLDACIPTGLMILGLRFLVSTLNGSEIYEHVASARAVI